MFTAGRALVLTQEKKKVINAADKGGSVVIYQEIVHPLDFVQL